MGLARAAGTLTLSNPPVVVRLAENLEIVPLPKCELLINRSGVGRVRRVVVSASTSKQTQNRRVSEESGTAHACTAPTCETLRKWWNVELNMAMG